MKKKPYRKLVYWLTKKEVSGLRRSLKERDIRLKEAKGIVCAPLDPLNKIAGVPPEVWNATCARQGSWYRNSPKNGLTLIVSTFELEGFESRKEAVLTESDFIPPRWATPEEKESMVADPVFSEKMPGQWTRIEETEKRIYLRWARRLGSDVEGYDFLYLSHTANHANFVVPRFFVEDETGIVPYSIDRSAHLCSCCVELFQVLGYPYQRKFVAPCPGATIFARLPQDRYLLVSKT